MIRVNEEDAQNYGFAESFMFPHKDGDALEKRSCIIDVTWTRIRPLPGLASPCLTLVGFDSLANVFMVDK